MIAEYMKIMEKRYNHSERNTKHTVLVGSPDA